MPRTNQLWRHAVTITYPLDREDEWDVDNMRTTFTDLASKWIFQLERGEEAGKLHVQGRMRVRDKKRCTTLVKDLARVLGLPAEWITVRAESDEVGSFTYCLKEDTRVDGPWADSPIYLGSDLICMSTPHPWQSQVLGWIEKEPDDRTIHWVFDPVGNHGKSKLCKWLRYKGLAMRIPMGTATQIKTAVLAMGSARCFVVDLPRVRGSDETKEALFSAVEDIKGGWVQSAMYGKFQELLFVPAHVIIFSNELPSYMMASLDRWAVYGFDALDKPLKKLARPVVIEKEPAEPAA